MSRYLPLVVLVTSLNCFATIQPEITAFLKSFPDKMSCKGIEVKLHTETRAPMQQKVTITITGKATDHPMIEVDAPSASTRGKYKIGNGYGGRPTASGNFSYLFLEAAQVLYYVRVLNEGDSVDAAALIRIRDAGGLASFSSNRVCSTTYHCFELSECSSVSDPSE